MNDSDFFLKIDQSVDSIIPIIDEFLTTVKWDWKPYNYLSKDAWRIEKKLLEVSPVLSKFQKQFGGQLHMLHLPEHAMYTWHYDYNTNCSLNMVLEDYNCHTLFSKGKHPLDQSTERINILDIVELKYEPKKFHIFSNSISHCVINLGKERTLITWTFPKSVTYESVRDWYLNTF
jgi:hypothetical protein